MASEEAAPSMSGLWRHAGEVVVRSRDGVVQWVSGAVREVLGFEPDELVGLAVHELMHPDDAGEGHAAPGMLIPKPADRRWARFRLRNGGYRWMVASTTAPLVSHGDETLVTTWRASNEEARARSVADRPLAGANLPPRHDRARRTQTEAERHAATLRALLDPHVVIEPVRDGSGHVVDFVCVEVNEAAAAYIGQDRADLVGARLLTLLPSQRTSGMFDLYVDMLRTGNPLRLEAFPYQHEVHGLRRYDVSAVLVGESIAYTFRDVTDREIAASRLAASEARWRQLADGSPDVVVHIEHGRFTFVSSSVTAALGWHPRELVDHSIDEIVHPDDSAIAQRRRQTVLDGHEPVRFRMRVRAADGSYRWVEAHGTRPPDGTELAYIGSWRIIDDQVAAEHDLEQRASLDPLTGLLNRAGLTERLNAPRRRPRSNGTETAIIYADLDAFKAINDTHGHAIGDQVLKAVSARIVREVRRDDPVARIGGDELLIVLFGVTTVDAAAVVADKIAESVRRPIATTAGLMNASLSIGVTLLSSHDTADAAIRHADEAMYRAKRAGGDRVVVSP